MFEKFKYNPENGLMNYEKYPTRPVSENEARKQFQDIFDKIRDELNHLYETLENNSSISCGASHIGSKSIFGLEGNNVYSQLTSLKRRLDDMIENPTAVVAASYGEVSAAITSLNSSISLLNERIDRISTGNTSDFIEIIRTTKEFTVPETGVYKVTVIGGGGGGGGGAGTNSATAYHQAGGGGGGTAVKWMSLTGGQNISAIVGIGGTGGIATTTADNYSDGNAGGESNFNGVRATGGEGGYYHTKTASLSKTGLGGVGSGGDININGGKGAYSFFITANDQNTYVSNSGGNSYMGQGGRAYVYSLVKNNGSSYTGITGDNGTGFGGGGGGAAFYGYLNQGFRGGNGSNGVIVIESAFSKVRI